MSYGNTAGEEFYEVSGVEDGSGVIGLVRLLTNKLPCIRSGVHTFRVVLTDMLPSMRSRVQAMWWVAKAIKYTK